MDIYETGKKSFVNILVGGNRKKSKTMKKSILCLILLLITSFSTYSQMPSFNGFKCESGNCIDGTGRIYFPKSPDSYIYIGEFKNSKANGKGIYLRNLVEKWEGNFIDNEINGFGTYSRCPQINYKSCKVVYEGIFQSGNYHGQGTFYFDNGDKYVGNFKSGHLAQGILYYNDGSIYNGEFKDDERDGKGTLVYSNGDKYVGVFEKNNPKSGNLISKSNPAILDANNIEYQQEMLDRIKRDMGRDKTTTTGVAVAMVAGGWIANSILGEREYIELSATQKLINSCLEKEFFSDFDKKTFHNKYKVICWKELNGVRKSKIITISKDGIMNIIDPQTNEPYKLIDDEKALLTVAKQMCNCPN